MCSPFRHELTFLFTHGVSTWLALATPNGPNGPNAPNAAMRSPFRHELICSSFEKFHQNYTKHKQPTENKDTNDQ